MSDREPKSPIRFAGEWIPRPNPNHNVLTGLELEVVRYRENLTRWKVYKTAVYWSHDKTVLLTGLVGYDQILHIGNYTQLSKAGFEKVVDCAQKLDIEIHKNKAIDEHLSGILTNKKPMFRSLSPGFNWSRRFVLSYIDENDLSDSEELMYSLANNKKLVLPENFSLKRKAEKTALLMLVHAFQYRLTSIQRYEHVVNFHGTRVRFEVERLHHDPDASNLNSGMRAHYQYY